MSGQATFTPTYLECPECGTRYLARPQRRADAPTEKPRWFTCCRCEKRVMSIARAQPVAEQHA